MEKTRGRALFSLLRPDLQITHGFVNTSTGEKESIEVWMPTLALVTGACPLLLLPLPITFLHASHENHAHTKIYQYACANTRANADGMEKVTLWILKVYTLSLLSVHATL